MNNMNHPIHIPVPFFKRIGNRGDVELYSCEKCASIVYQGHLVSHTCRGHKKVCYPKRGQRKKRDIKRRTKHQTIGPRYNSQSSVSPLTLQQLQIMEEDLLEKLAQYKQPEAKTLDLLEECQIPYTKRKTSLVSSK